MQYECDDAFPNLIIYVPESIFLEKNTAYHVFQSPLLPPLPPPLPLPPPVFFTSNQGTHNRLCGYCVSS